MDERWKREFIGYLVNIYDVNPERAKLIANTQDSFSKPSEAARQWLFDNYVPTYSLCGGW